MTSRIAFVVHAVLYVFVPAYPAAAQLPFPRLDSIFPAGGKAGSMVDVQLRGADLDGVTQLRFTHVGLIAEPKTDEPNRYYPDPRPRPGEFTVRIAENVPPGIYEVRALGQFGVSNPRLFHVGALNSVVQTDNTTLEKAMPLELDTTASGWVDTDGVDFFRFDVQAGARLLIDCRAQRIDSLLNATVALFDPDGREIARVRGSAGRDPVLAFVAERDGPHTLALYDFVHRGGTDHFYRLSLCRGPCVQFVYPPCAEPGARSKLTFYGYYLPGGQPVERQSAVGVPLEKTTVETDVPPADSAGRTFSSGIWTGPLCGMTEGWVYRLGGRTSDSTSVFVPYARAPVLTENEPNDEPENAESISLPCEYVGRFSKPADRDWVTFLARTNQVFTIEVISHRMGMRCDPVLLVQQAVESDQGEQRVTQLARVDNVSAPPSTINLPAFLRTSSDDPAYRLNAEKGATYRIGVYDLYGSDRPSFSTAYRLVIRPEEPDFQMAAYVMPPDQRDGNRVLVSSPVLRRGGAIGLVVRLVRTGGFDGQVEVLAEGLPQGVKCHSAVIAGNVDWGALVLTAENDAPAWLGDIRIVGRADVGGRKMNRTARPAAVVWQSTNVREHPHRLRFTERLSLSVLDAETVPARITAGDGSVLETSVGGRLEVPIRVAREEGFAAAVSPVAEGLPREIQVKTGGISGAEGKLELSLANDRVPVGTYAFCLRAATKAKRIRNKAAIEAAEVDQKRLGQMVTELADNHKQAEESKALAERRVKQAQEQLEQAQAAAEKPATGELAEGGSHKTVAEAETELSAANKAAAAAEEAAADAAQLFKEAQDVEAAADKRLTDVRNANKEREFEFELISTPIRVRVHPTPIVLRSKTVRPTVRPGENVAVEIEVQRRFGFEDQVEMTLTAPSGVAGIAGKQVAIPKGQTTAKLEISADENATLGEHEFYLVGRLQFNNISLEEKTPLILKVEKKDS